VDVTVLLAVFGVLTALVLPAVLQAQGVARRPACINNLKQLGLACHNYHDAFNHFPTEQSRKGFYEQLLPYVEEKNADPRKPKPIKVFLCPDRHQPTAPYRDYGYVYDNKLVTSPILFEKNGATLAGITNLNGASNTALLAHIWMNPDAYAKDKATWADKTHYIQSAVSKPDSREKADNPTPARRSPGDSTATAPPPANAVCLGSSHPTGNPTLFADGHVQILPNKWLTANPATWNWKNDKPIQLP